MKMASIALWILAGLLFLLSLYFLNVAAGMYWLAGSFHPEGWETTVKWATVWLLAAICQFVAFLWVMTRNLVRLGKWEIEITWRWLLALLPLVIGLFFLYASITLLVGNYPSEEFSSVNEKLWTLIEIFGFALLCLAVFALVVRRNLRVTRAHQHQE